MKLIHRLDWFNRISGKELRNENHTKNADGLDLVLAEEQLASVSKGKWKYGYDSLYRIFLRIPFLRERSLPSHTHSGAQNGSSR